MTGPLEARAGKIVDFLLTLPEPRRTDAARLICAGDDALLNLVVRCLSAEAQDDLLRRVLAHRTPAAVLHTAGPTGPNHLSNQVPNQIPTQLLPQAIADEALGTTIGPYKLLGRVGEGGFGVVYAAEQAHPISRRVALKIIKPGMDSRAVIARFEAERQALALMDHPNIAKVFDAGATRAGRPFFVMELVRGVPITEYCEENRLSPRERIELMIPVCHAIQHAHQRAIIHRDIKPGNVLVSITDGKPVPKVIAFGVAKAMSGQLTDKTVYTAFRQFIGTPAYMSPEQLLQSGVDVDTRSDVYALGVLMYELLAGSLPYDAESLLKLGLDAMQQAVRETDPPKPSTRVMTMEAGARTTVAASRRLQPEKLTGILRGEVDWMVMKAVEKDRNRRYQSPAELAEDLGRYLTGEPVSASPPAGLYRTRKFIRRNRVAVTLLTVALMGLLATAIGTSFGLTREAAARVLAQKHEQAARAAQTLAETAKTTAEANLRLSRAAMGFIPSILSGANRSKEGGRADVTVREMLDRAVLLLEKGTDADGQPLDPGVEAQARKTIGDLYHALGMFARGSEVLQAAIPLTQELWGPGSIDELEILLSLSWGQFNEVGTPAEMIALDERIQAIAAALPDRKTKAIGWALGNRSLVLHRQSRYAEALEADCKRIAFWDTFEPPDQLQLSGSCADAAVNSVNIGKRTDALRLARRAVELQEALGDESKLIRRLAVYAYALAINDRLDEAESQARRSVELCERLDGPASPLRRFERQTLAEVLIFKGDLDEGSLRFDDVFQDRVARGIQLLLEDFFTPIIVQRKRGNTRAALDEVEAFFVRARAIPPDSRDNVPLGHPNNAYRYATYCGILTDNGRPADGIAALTPVYDAFTTQYGQDPDNFFALQMAGELLRAAEASGTVEHLQLARRLRATYPGLKPAIGYAPAK